MCMYAMCYTSSLQNILDRVSVCLAMAIQPIDMLTTGYKAGRYVIAFNT